jgi:aminoglycoside 2'-N-acetyltransferase I
VEIQTGHTAELGDVRLTAVHGLLVDVFGEWLTDEDWDHALGGVHAIALEDGVPIGHASVVQRQLTNDGRTLRTGYVEGVAVRADRRRAGVAAALMCELERVIRAAYPLGALAATDDGAALYEAIGWGRWGGPLAAFTPRGIEATSDEAVFVLEVDCQLDRAAALIADWRAGDVW